MRSSNEEQDLGSMCVLCWLGSYSSRLQHACGPNGGSAAPGTRRARAGPQYSEGGSSGAFFACNRGPARGHSIVESAVEGAVLRLRPIIMTMLVATLGLLPAAMSHAIGSDSQRPFAIVIMIGLMVNLAMSIFILPTLYVWFAREGDKLPEPEESFDAKPGAV